jgi:GDP-4-dehydro-6-deoxy-D-mannose reductase
LRILVTGAGGFAGSHLADALLNEPTTQVWGILREPGRPAYLDSRVQCDVLELCNLVDVNHYINHLRPDRIYHLAGQAFVPQSWADPWDTLETNIRAELNILHACVQAKVSPRVLVVGSQEQYGRLQPHELPATEESPLRPDNPYGVSKIAQDYLGLSYFIRYQLPVISVRPFNHIGPRQGRRFVASDFAHQIVAIERDDQEPIMRVGNLSAERDFTDVRDVARAYIAALEYGTPGEAYNVASGISRSIQSLLDGLLVHSQRKVTVETDPAKLRPSDTPRQQGDAGKLRQATGWQPQIAFEQTLKDILDYERQNYS